MYDSDYHSHDYADTHHSHRELDDERYDRERAIGDAEININARITDLGQDCRASREELWGRINELEDQHQHLNAAVLQLTQRLDDHLELGSHAES